MEGRAADEQVAATRIITGADVDYGSLTRSLVRYLEGMTGFTAHYAHRVTHISREPGGRWRIEMKNQHGGETHSTTAKFVYLGAGGGALLLLQKSGIPEGRGYGGFPVSGIWLLTANRWLPKLKEMIPSYGESLIDDAALSRRIRADTAAVLHLENV